MTLSIHRISEPQGLRLEGELDIAGADDLALALEPLVTAGGDIFLDVSALSFLDSSGIFVLARAAAAVEGRGTVVLLHPAPTLRRVVGVAGLQRFPNFVMRD